ncbi:MAG: NAD(P)-dependent oxidoreductase [Rhodobacteraceae bacterium]|jgi:UDP-glucose 4-epimerase|nr:NAD(P)-dependent oxidoreductase [Paracoccaceae bacterium]
MRIAITGGSGGIGRAIADAALAKGHAVVSIDRTDPATPVAGITYIRADTGDYRALVAAFAGCDAMIHMAAIPNPQNDPAHVVHNANVVGSYNALCAAVETGITRLCQASSVNAIGQAYSRHPRYDYIPIDEDHPNHAEDPYALSKWICEQQADAFARRYEGVSIASLRFHWVLPDRATAMQLYAQTDLKPRNHLWAYTRRDMAADACLRAVATDLRGHEVFYIVAPDTASDRPSRDLAAAVLPEVPLRDGFGGRDSFMTSAKAARLLGWVHPPGDRA